MSWSLVIERQCHHGLVGPAVSEPEHLMFLLPGPGLGWVQRWGKKQPQLWEFMEHGSWGWSQCSALSDLILFHRSQESLPRVLFLTWSPELSTESLREHAHPLHWTGLTSNTLVTPASQSLVPQVPTGKCNAVWWGKPWYSHQRLDTGPVSSSLEVMSLWDKSPSLWTLGFSSVKWG